MDITAGQTAVCFIADLPDRENVLSFSFENISGIIEILLSDCGIAPILMDLIAHPQHG